MLSETKLKIYSFFLFFQRIYRRVFHIVKNKFSTLYLIDSTQYFAKSYPIYWIKLDIQDPQSAKIPYFFAFECG